MSEADPTHCLFCAVVAGTVPSQRVYEDEHVVAFRDIKPQAPVHVLVIPRRHISGIDVPEAEQGEVLSLMIHAANLVARQEGVDQGGYRLVWNVGPDSGQSVFHLHLHVLGGRRLGWPPG